MDFYFLPDGHLYPTPDHLTHAGEVAEDEFAMAQQVGLLDHHTDYYDDFRWTSEQVGHKLFLLASCPMRDSTAFQDILARAQAAGVGLLAVGE